MCDFVPSLFQLHTGSVLSDGFQKPAQPITVPPPVCNTALKFVTPEKRKAQTEVPFITRRLTLHGT